jgi:hypothetical protein
VTNGQAVYSEWIHRIKGDSCPKWERMKVHHDTQEQHAI